MKRLMRHRWPGNVRELENAVERAVVLCRGDTITPGDLPLLGEPASDDRMPAVPGASLVEMERWMILKTLEYTGGSTTRAAEILAMSARKIQYKLHEYRGH